MVTIHQLKSKEEYENFISTGNRVLKVSAAWCGPCRTLSNTISTLDANKVNDTLFGEIDADDDFADEITSNLKIRGIPVLVYFKDGKEIDRSVGGVQAVDIYNRLEKFNE